MSLEDVGYAMFEQGFDKAVAQVKHFNTNVPINFARIDREQNLEDIIEQESCILP